MYLVTQRVTTMMKTAMTAARQGEVVKKIHEMQGGHCHSLWRHSGVISAIDPGCLAWERAHT